MILREILLAASLALQASAFLIPLEVIKEVESVNKLLETPWTIQESTIALDCPGCIYPGPAQEGIEYSKHDDNFLEFHIAVENSERLKLNGQTIYPFRELMEAMPVLTAPQIRKSDSTPSLPHALGFAIRISYPDVDDEDGKMVSLTFTVLDIEHTLVKVDVIKVDLIHDEGNLVLARISTIPFLESPGAAECTTSLCRLRAILVQQFRSALEAVKGHADKASTWMTSKGCHGKDGKHFHHGKNKGHHYHKSHKPHHPHDHHKHHGHFTLHRLGHLLRKMLRFFIVPALLGVIGGLLASAVGMLVGQAIVYLWFRFHRGGNRGPIRLTETTVLEEEKAPPLHSGELPPQYEDVEVIVVEDNKE